jgi:cysteine desulfuration protein SufE
MIPPKLQETLDDLEMLTDRQERIDYLISLAQEFQNPGAEVVPRSPETRVPGCESEVYISPDLKIAVDNPQGVSAMALAVILESALANAAPDQVEEVPEEVVYRIFGRELSMGKSMGLTGMVRMVKAVSGRHGHS